MPTTPPAVSHLRITARSLVGTPTGTPPVTCARPNPRSRTACRRPKSRTSPPHPTPLSLSLAHTSLRSTHGLHERVSCAVHERGPRPAPLPPQSSDGMGEHDSRWVTCAEAALGRLARRRAASTHLAMHMPSPRRKASSGAAHDLFLSHARAGVQSPAPSLTPTPEDHDRRRGMSHVTPRDEGAARCRRGRRLPPGVPLMRCRSAEPG